MLIDDILSVYDALEDPRGQLSTLLAALRQSTVIKVHNVADYVFEKPALEWNIEEDFPNIVPPFPDIWMEWRHRRCWGIRKAHQDFPDEFRAGVLLTSIDTRRDGVHEDRLKKAFPEARWISCAYYFLDIGSDIRQGVGAPPGLGYGVSEDGRFVKLNGGVSLLPNPVRSWEEPTAEQAEAMNGFLNFLCVPFMALSFMHCKNVEFLKGPAHPPRLQKARQDRGKPPLLRWHTLTVEPVKRIIASANGGDSGLTPKSLHICRGHFKHFIDHGLFGKYHGTYWWPMHARGSRETGVVLKDYQVRPGPAIGSVDGR